MKYTKCTIYDCEFENYVDGVIINNVVYVYDETNNIILPKEKVCEYVDYGMVQFFIGEYNYIKDTGNAKWGYLNLLDGEIVVPPIYDKAFPFYGDRACVMLNGKYGFIDPWGNIIVKLIWDNSYITFHNGLCPVKKSFLWGYIDKDGNAIIKPRFEESNHFEEFEKGIYIAKVKKDSKYGYIDEYGKFVISPVFEILDRFSMINNKTFIALVKKEHKYGYIDIAEKYIVEAHFDDAKPFWKKGYAPVMIKGLWAYIDIHGEFVIPFQFQEVGDGFFNDDFYPVKKNDKWGIIDENLNILMPGEDKRYVIYKDRKIYIKEGRITSKRKFSG